MEKNRQLLLLLALIFVLLLSVTAFAQDEVDVGDEELEDAAPKPSLLMFIKSGGVIGFVIIILSFVAMALIIESCISLSKKSLIPPDFLVGVRELMARGSFGQARELCNNNDSYVARIIRAALSYRSLGPRGMLRAAEDAIREETTKLAHKTGLLYLVSSIAPMLGLLGTVIGMILAFQQIESMKKMPTPGQIADPIKVALVTTAEGLIVAVPTLIAYYFFRNRVTMAGLEASSIIEEMIKPYRKKRPESR